MDYQELKTKLSPHKDKFVLGVCFLLVFIVGFGSGKFVKEKKSSESSTVPTNYTTKKVVKPITAEGEGIEAKVLETATTVPAAVIEKCIIKGNIPAKGKKLYHVQGGAFYQRVKAEQCFNTEQEALAAGYEKSSR